MELEKKTEFMQAHGHRIVKVHDDDADGGDLMLLHPEEDAKAMEYHENGYEVFSVFEPLMQSDDEDVVCTDLTAFFGIEFGKIGYFVLRYGS